MRSRQLARTLGYAQAAIYVTTGLWSLVHRQSFERVTGSKSDYWLVQVVGALVVPIGLSIGIGASRGSRAPETLILAVGSATALAACDIVYVARRRISPVYLLDAVIELLIAGGWLLASVRRRPNRT
jgi:hypothetical protein